MAFFLQDGSRMARERQVLYLILHDGALMAAPSTRCSRQRRMPARATSSSRRWLESSDPEVLAHRRAEAELLFRRIGITFAVYGDADAEERIIPFDIIPRVLTKPEWERLSAGPRAARHARSTCFLADIYGNGEILRDGAVPRRPRLPQSLLPAGDGRPQAAPRHLRPHRRHRHRARRRRRFLRAGGQCPHARPASPTCWRTAR